MISYIMKPIFTLQTTQSKDERIPRKGINYQNDLFEISYQANKNPNNVLSYKRIKQPKIRERNVLTTAGNQQSSIQYEILTQNQRFMRDQSIDHHRHEMLHTQTSKFSLQKNMQKTLDPRKWKAISQEKPRFRSHSRESNSINATKQTFSGQKTHKATSKQKYSFKDEQPRELVDDQHLMNWLNQVLSDYCLSDEAPQNNGQFKALERFGLDKSSLLSRGLHPEAVGMLHRTLFVHSLGFQSSIKELCSHNLATTKSIWKAYAILLQYCSQGYFQTMMGELQRDMIKNEAKLRQQIEKRQRMIDTSQQRMQLKLKKFQKENKELKKQLAELTQKKQQLESEFRQVEMAYNMEVTLRLKYQHKINKIYSIHQRLNILHANLFRDFQQTDALNQHLSSESAKIKQRNIDLCTNYQQLSEELSGLKTAIRSSQAMIEGLRMNQKQLQAKITDFHQTKRDEIFELKDKERKINQLQQEVKSCNLVLEIMKTSANTQLEEYRKVSEENIQLRLHKKDNLEKINELIREISHLNGKQSNLKSQLDYSQSLNHKFKENIQQLDKERTILQENIQTLQIQLKSKQIQISSFLKTIESCNKTVSDTKNLYEKARDQSILQKKYSIQLRCQLEQSRQQRMQYQLLVKSLQNEKFELQLQLSRKINEILTLNKQRQSQSHDAKKKYDALYNTWAAQDNIQSALQQQIETLKRQLQSANIRISFLSNQFTDLTFQKAKIEAHYNNNLVLHDKQKQSQKELLIQISAYTEQINDFQRELAKQVKVNNQRQQQWNNDKRRLNQLVQQLKQKLGKKQGFVHPMIFEDAVSQILSLQQLICRLKSAVQNQKQKQQQIQIRFKLDYTKKQAELRSQMKQIEANFNSINQQLQKQCQYLQHKYENINSANYDLQVKLKSQLIEIKKQEQETAQQRVATLLKQKNQQITQLYSELERIEDNFNQKTYSYQAQIQSLKRQNQEVITSLKNEKISLQDKIAKIQEEYVQKLTEKEKEMEEVKMRAWKWQRERGDMGEMKRGQFIAKLKIATKHNNK